MAIHHGADGSRNHCTKIATTRLQISSGYSGQGHSRVAIRDRGASVPGIEGFLPSMMGKMPPVPAIPPSGPAAHADSRQA